MTIMLSKVLEFQKDLPYGMTDPSFFTAKETLHQAVARMNYCVTISKNTFRFFDNHFNAVKNISCLDCYPASHLSESQSRP